ncbi:MAG: hypothetical protein KAH48_09595, partial [Chlorobi bacterium]|nr:hypothetical protein [Chlorobiota bacterium]
MFKTILFFFVLLISFPVHADMNFEFKEFGFFPEDERTATINSVRQISNNFYAVGANGLVIRLIDEDWEYILGDIGMSEIYDFIEYNGDYLLLTEGNVLLTYNKQWEKTKTYSMSFPNNFLKMENNTKYSFILTAAGTVIRTKNDSWAWNSVELDLPINNIVVDDFLVFLLGDNGQYYYSEDFGQSFVLKSVDDDMNIRSFSRSKNQFVASGNKNYIMFSSNNGSSWEKRITSESVENIEYITFINDSTLMATFGKGSMISFNSGAKWESHQPYWDTYFSSKICFDSEICFVYKDSFINKYMIDDIFNKSEIFSKASIYITDIHLNKSNNKIDLLSGFNYFYNPKSDKAVFRKMPIPIIKFNDVCYKDSLLYIAKDSMLVGTQQRRNSNIIVYDMNSNYRYTISVDSGYYFNNIFEHNDKLYLFSFRNYYYEFDISTKKMIKIVLADSIGITKIKYINGEIVMSGSSGEHHIIRIDEQNEIKNIIDLPIDQYPVDFSINSSGEILTIQNYTSTGHTTDSFIYKTSPDGTEYETVFSQLGLLQKLGGISKLNDNEFMVYGKGNLVYTDDSFESYSAYMDVSDFDDFQKIDNTFLTIKNKHLFSVSLIPTSVKEAPASQTQTN